MATGSHVLTSPATLIAEIPGILGFYPHESLLLLAMNRVQPDSQRFELGPVTRLDLDDDEVLSAVVDLALVPGSVLDCDLLMGVIVTQVSSRIDSTLVILREGGVDTSCFWHVPEIMQDAPYSLLVEGGTDIHDEWTLGTLPSVADAYTTREVLDRGELLAEAREEALASLTAPNPALDAEAVSALNRDVNDRIKACIPPTPATMRDVLTLADEAVKQAQGKSLDELLTARESIARVATALALDATRDGLAETLVSRPTSSSHLLTAVARSVAYPLVQSNALALLALTSTAMGSTFAPLHALHASLRVKSDNTLTNMLMEAHSIPQLRLAGLLPNIHKGSRASRNKLGLV